MPTDRRIARMREVISNRQPDLTVICENIHDPHNVSAILRSCDAVGVETMNLLYTDTVFPKLGKKSSASAKKWIDIRRHDSYAELRASLKQKEFTIYATYLDQDARSIYDVDWTQPSAIVMGNESRGVTDEMLEIADATIYIPMMGMIQSLNVSVATATILYEAYRQRNAAGNYPNAGRSVIEQEALLQKWKER